MKEIDPIKKLSDIAMFDEASNVQLTGRLLKVNDPKLTVMHGVVDPVKKLSDIAMFDEASNVQLT